MRQRVSGLLCVVSAFAVLSSCSGGKGGGTTAPTPTPTSITVVSSATTMFLGQTENFSANFTLSNGTTQIVTGGTWGSDAPSVATVNATTGLVTAVGKGDVTIFVDAQGLRGTKRITVNATFAGFWTGSYLMASCSQTGDFALANLCASISVGSSYPVIFNLAQTGSTVTGTVALGSLTSSPFTATVAANGSLTFTAVYQDGTFRISQAWQISVAQSGQLTGSVVQTWSDSTASGSMILNGTLQTVTKSGGDRLMTAEPRPTIRSWSDALEALKRGR